VSGFKLAGDIAREEMDWGVFASVSSPRDGLRGIVTVEATFLPGKCHDFHYHPGQEEVIYVVEGEVEQWIERESRVLRPGDAVAIGESVVHASFNDADVPAKIIAILSPAVGEEGYGVEDVSGDEPWASLRGGS
jgi:quercetin dioxygenase-like cupin family protein